MIDRIFLHATYSCNAKCIHCAVPKNSDMLPLTDFKRMADVSKNNGVNYIMIGGGEPLLHPDILEMVMYAHKNGIKVKIETNGKLLNKGKLEQLKDSLFQMNVSLDGCNQKTHDEIRGLDTFQNTVESIKYARAIGIDVAVWSVVMKDNAKEVHGIINLARGLGVDKISFLYATPVGACYSNKERVLLDSHEYYDLLRTIKSEDKGMQVRMAPYLIPFNMVPDFQERCTSVSSNLGCMIYEKGVIHIDPQGSIFPCVLLLGESSYIMGNAKNDIDLSGVLSGDSKYWDKILRTLDEHKAHAKIAGYAEAGCVGLCIAHHTKIDPRSGEGLPICPSKTVMREWMYEKKPIATKVR